MLGEILLLDLGAGYMSMFSSGKSLKLYLPCVLFCVYVLLHYKAEKAE